MLRYGWASTGRGGRSGMARERGKCRSGRSGGRRSEGCDWTTDGPHYTPYGVLRILIYLAISVEPSASFPLTSYITTGMSFSTERDRCRMIDEIDEIYIKCGYGNGFAAWMRWAQVPPIRTPALSSASVPPRLPSTNRPSTETYGGTYTYMSPYGPARAASPSATVGLQDGGERVPHVGGEMSSLITCFFKLWPGETLMIWMTWWGNHDLLCVIFRIHHSGAFIVIVARRQPEINVCRQCAIK